MTESKPISSDDMNFIRRCMRGSKVQMAVIAIVAMAGGVLMLVMAYYAESTLGRLVWGAMGLLAIPASGLMLRQSLQGGTHPVILALEDDPTQLTALEVTGYSVQGFKSESSQVTIRTQDSAHVVYCNRKAKRDRLLHILLKHAPHLRNQTVAW